MNGKKSDLEGTGECREHYKISCEHVLCSECWMGASSGGIEEGRQTSTHLLYCEAGCLVIDWHGNVEEGEINFALGEQRRWILICA